MAAGAEGGPATAHAGHDLHPQHHARCRQGPDPLTTVIATRPGSAFVVARQTVGLSGRTAVEAPDSSEGGRSYGLHLARHGYVSLSIDLLTDGEPVEPGEEPLQTRRFYKRHPE